MLKTINVLLVVWLFLLTLTQRNINAAIVYDTMTISGLVMDVGNLQQRELSKSLEKKR